MKHTLHGSLQKAAIFVLGCVVGAIAMLIHSGELIDKLYAEQARLELQASSLEEEVRALERQLSEKNTQRTVQKITVLVENAPDGLTEAEVIKKVQEETRYLIGKEVDSVAQHPELLFHLLDDRTYRFHERQIRLHPKVISISSEMRFWLEIRVENAGAEINT